MKHPRSHPSVCNDSPYGSAHLVRGLDVDFERLTRALDAQAEAVIFGEVKAHVGRGHAAKAAALHHQLPTPLRHCTRATCRSARHDPTIAFTLRRGGTRAPLPLTVSSLELDVPPMTVSSLGAQLLKSDACMTGSATRLARGSCFVAAAATLDTPSASTRSLVMPPWKPPLPSGCRTGPTATATYTRGALLQAACDHEQTD